MADTVIIRRNQLWRLIRVTGGATTVLVERTTSNPIAAFGFVDTPPAGTHVYKLQVKDQQAKNSVSDSVSGYTKDRFMSAMVLKK